MIGAEHRWTAFMRLKLCAVRKLETRPRSNESGILQYGQVRIQGDTAERHDQADTAQDCKFAFQKRPARQHLIARGLIIGWNAARRGSDIGVRKRQTIFPRRTVRLIRETRFEQRSIEKFTRAVAGEDSAGAVAAVRSRRETNNQQAGRGIPESRNRPAPIFLPPIGAPLYSADLFAMSDEAWAAKATRYFLVQDMQSI